MNLNDLNSAVARPDTATALSCYHCGQPCDELLWASDKPFCCIGCKTVFEILDSNELCEYYTLDTSPGNRTDNLDKDAFAYLDEEDIRKKVISFDSEHFASVSFFVPGIHCVSCIWLLENLEKLRDGILKSQVNFPRKTVVVEFNPRRVSLAAVARTLGQVGYPPQINLDSDQPAKKSVDKTLIIKLGLAGFCFGNVMLFSFPEYLGIDHSDKNLMRIFSYLNLGLSVPVFLYSGYDYLRNAVRSFSQRQINIDVPIAAGLVALFCRSSYDILTATGPGYLDSFTGLVFFLLIGRWFQSKTYESLTFDRDYRSYFPLAVNRFEGGEWTPVFTYALKPNDQIRIRNLEILPADSRLVDDIAYIDYSFVTGEAKPLKALKGNLIYAGGRNIGAPITLIIEKKTSQSHLTSLWNNDAFKKADESKYKKIIDRAARVFTWVVLFIAFCTSIYWYFHDPSEMWLVLTAVLMVACPCALALAAPFTYGSMLRVFGIHNLYLKNADIIEKLASVDHIVFDKTGTITHGESPEITFIGTLSAEQMGMVKTLSNYSTHPLSVMIAQSVAGSFDANVTAFREIPGKGLEGCVNDVHVKVGSASYVGSNHKLPASASTVFVSFDGEVAGYFLIKNIIRSGLSKMVRRLQGKSISLLSGDNESEKPLMKSVFDLSATLLFNQSPQEKMSYIKHLQKEGAKVMMIGDGLNDAGALKQSDVGLAVTDNTGVFSPACDGILLGDKLQMLDKYLDLAKLSTTILKIAFGLSFFYNAVALTFAVTGNLTPLVAAILMPISSINVVGFSSLTVNYFAKRKLGYKTQLL
jgi:Cu+-exporting ATPase